MESSGCQVEDEYPWISLVGVCVAIFFLSLHMVAGIIACGVTAAVAVGVGIVMFRFRSRRLIFAASGAVLVLTLALTVGIMASSPKTVSSSVLNKGTETRIVGQYGKTMTFYVVMVRCQDAKNGYLVASLTRPAYDALRVGQIVELNYHTESVLGIWNLGIVAESINSKPVFESDSWGFHGAGWDTFRTGMALVFGLAGGLIPPCYFVYKERKRKRKLAPHP